MDKQDIILITFIILMATSIIFLSYYVIRDLRLATSEKIRKIYYESILRHIGKTKSSITMLDYLDKNSKLETKEISKIKQEYFNAIEKKIISNPRLNYTKVFQVLSSQAFEKLPASEVLTRFLLPYLSEMTKTHIQNLIEKPNFKIRLLIYNPETEIISEIEQSSETIFDNKVVIEYGNSKVQELKEEKLVKNEISEIKRIVSLGIEITREDVQGAL